jgi:hypothetical protein
LTQIVLNHITRMKSSRICIAGIEVGTKRHLRPVTSRNDPMTRALLADEGGSIQLGAGVELGQTTATPNRPETEDHLCQTRNFEALGVLSDQEYLDLLGKVDDDDLATAFGQGLLRNGHTYAMEAGGGDYSLACVRAGAYDRLSIDFGTLHLRAFGGARISVTDVRFFESDQKTLRADVISNVNARLRRGVGAYLMLGLSRPWARPDEDEEFHWLQLNGICLEDSPLGAAP